MSLRVMLSAVLATGLLAISPALTSPASATAEATAGSAAMMTLTLHGGECEDLSRQFLCSMSYSGAVEPVTIRWYRSGIHISAVDDMNAAFIGCVPPRLFEIRGVVTDATGASVEFTTNRICRVGNP